MPAKPRSAVFAPDEVGIYHCYNRIVRRRHLFGWDLFTKKDYAYRKDWVREQLRLLAGQMAIEILDYAVLDNHLHTVLRNRPDIVERWSDEEVARRWWRVCPKRKQADGSAAEPTEGELGEFLKDIGEYRKRLSDISWLMRLAQQRVARRANQEDDVDGRFFAKRFDCERLEDEASVLNCSLYVDLNWIHAGMAETPEESRYTSAHERIVARWRRTSTTIEPSTAESRDCRAEDDWLAPIFLDERADAYVGATTAPVGRDPHLDAQQTNHDSTEADEACASDEPTGRDLTESKASFSNPLGSSRVSDKGFLRMTLDEYLELLDTVGRAIRPGKHGSIPRKLAPILQRLGLKPRKWLVSIFEMFRSRPNMNALAPS